VPSLFVTVEANYDLLPPSELYKMAPEYCGRWHTTAEVFPHMKKPLYRIMLCNREDCAARPPR
jgi:hypothetical protein